LHSRIQAESISTDERVIAFASRENEEEELERLLGLEQQRYWAEQLLQTFDFKKVLTALENFLEELPGKKLPDPKASRLLGEVLHGKAKEKQEVANKFRSELAQLLNSVPVSGTRLLEERVRKAITYFSNFFTEEMLLPVQEHEASLKKATKVKKYSKIVGSVKYALAIQLSGARYGDLVFNPLSNEEKKKIDSLKKAAVKKKDKAEKGSSLRETLALYRAGKNIPEISKHRGLATTTIEGHLALLVKAGELDIHELMEDQRLEVILDALNSTGNTSMTQVKQRLGDDYSYGEIRAVWNYKELAKQGDPN